MSFGERSAVPGCNLLPHDRYKESGSLLCAPMLLGESRSGEHSGTPWLRALRDQCSIGCRGASALLF